MMRQDSEGSRVTVRGDGRVTRIGTRLDQLKIDEIRGLWNLIRGDVSFVGPQDVVPRGKSTQEAELWQFVLRFRPLSSLDQEGAGTLFWQLFQWERDTSS